MNIRRVESSDLIALLTCNLCTLPENYCMQFWAYMILTWPNLSFLAEDGKGKVVGYVLSSIEPAEDDPRTQVGHINSLSVLRPYRRLGLGQKLMDLTKDAILREDSSVGYLQLHVRRSNRAARSLYVKLGYAYHEVDFNYYADDEDALIMRFPIQLENPPKQEEEESRSLHSDTQKQTRKSCVAYLWSLIQSKPRRFAEAAVALLRKKNSQP